VKSIVFNESDDVCSNDLHTNTQKSYCYKSTLFCTGLKTSPWLRFSTQNVGKKVSVCALNTPA